jgi:D-aminoacyl-tRNA deacylase
MKAVIQRVREAWVEVEGQRVAQIGSGALVLLGIASGDTREKCSWLSAKIFDLRFFDDLQGKLNLSLQEIGGELLIVSQFTLLGDCRKGRRPSYSNAASAEEARSLYEYFVACCRKSPIPVKAGIFQAHMQVGLINDGPVTLLLEI